MSDVESLYRSFINEFNNVLIRAGKKHGVVKLIAVSKLQSNEKIKAIYHEGQRDFGENYVQEALEKQEKLTALDIKWHFIGGLQKNKVKSVVGKFELIHSVDSLELGRKISYCAGTENVQQNCLLQINIGDETTKGGFSPISILDQIEELFSLPNICWQGLMVMPPITVDEKKARGYFQKTRDVFQKIQAQISYDQRREWIHLSMGTSHDFIWAIEEGATLVRVGTLVFGDRIKKIKN
jgi:hypothetical protein